MKAIRVSVGFNEWSKVDDFLRRFMYDVDTFTYLLDNVTFVAVFEGECAMEYFNAQLLTEFEEPIIVELK